MKKLLLLIISALLISGCATTPKANSLFSSEDLNFAEEMIPHHEQAVLMSDIALTNSASDEVLALARDIKAAQAPEIEQMSAREGVRTLLKVKRDLFHQI
jgi:type IV pilus biogenesis protein CpaD/CtpE